MKNKILVALIVTIGLLLICYVLMNNSENEDNSSTNEKEQNDTTVINVETFSNNSFSEGVEQNLLVEIGICDTLIDGFKLPCEPNFFRFFPLQKNKPLKDGFILLVNSRGYKDSKSFFTQRRIFVFERERGKLVEVNKFKANLVELRVSKLNGYYDLLLRFRDSKKDVFYCSYRWTNGKYNLYKCEEIAEYGDRAPRKVKIEFIDSVSIEIDELLKNEGLAF
jgi:hypothetical protein